MDKHCFVLPSNLTVSFVNNPLIHLVVGLNKFDVIWLFIVLNVIKINFINSYGMKRQITKYYVDIP